MLLNDGAGAFSSGLTYGVGEFGMGRTVVPVDVNNDGTLDLAVGVVRSINLLYGHGDGTFASFLASRSDQIESLAVGDLDADGDPDMATLGAHQAELYVMINRGNGSYDTRVEYALPGPSAPGGVGETGGVAFGDLDGDLDLDLVVACSENQLIAVYMNDGDASFGAPTSYPMDSVLTHVEVADLNGDGHADVVAIGDLLPTTSATSVLLHNGDGTLTAFETQVLPSNATKFILGDLDADGDLDLVRSTGVVETNNGGGIFSYDATYNTFQSRFSALGDVEGDGDLDLVYANGPGSIVTRPNQCIPCTADGNRSGEVGFADLLRLMSNWGPCP